MVSETFDHPPARQHDKAGSGDTAHDDQSKAEQEADEQQRQAVVDAVGEHRVEPAVQPRDPAQQGACAVGILDVGGVDEDAHQQAAGIDRDVTFAAPFSVVLTLWMSMIAAVGLASRPCCSRCRTSDTVNLGSFKAGRWNGRDTGAPSRLRLMHPDSAMCADIARNARCGSQVDCIGGDGLGQAGSNGTARSRE